MPKILYLIRIYDGHIECCEGGEVRVREWLGEEEIKAGY